MHWSIVIDLAIPVAERAALCVEQLGEPMRHMGIGFTPVPTDRVRLVLAAGELKNEGELELIDETLARLAGSMRRFTFRLAAAAWYPSEEEARLLVAPVSEGAAVIGQLRKQLVAELGPELCRTVEQDERGDVVVLLGRLAAEEHAELRGLLPASASDLGSSVAGDLALVRWAETTGGPKWRVAKRYFLQG